MATTPFSKPIGVWKKPSVADANHQGAETKKIDERILYDFQFEIDKRPAGLVRIEFFEKVVPKTVAHFLKNIGEYKGSFCDRLKTDGWLQIDVLHPKNVAETIPDENFVIKHTKGTLSLVNNGPNTNGTAFMICLKDMPFFDGKYVGIGRVVDGMKVLETINEISTSLDVPDLAVKVVDIHLHTDNDEE